MKIADSASKDDNTYGGGEIPPCTGLAPDALPEVQKLDLAENLQSGVSTQNALSGNAIKTNRSKVIDNEQLINNKYFPIVWKAT